MGVFHYSNRSSTLRECTKTFADQTERESWTQYATDTTSSQEARMRALKRAKMSGMRKARTGVETLHAVHERLDNMPMRPTIMQKKIFHSFLNVIATKLIGNDKTSLDKVVKDYRWERLYTILGINMPRQNGKTTSVCMATVAYALEVANCEVAMFSTGRRLSWRLLQDVYAILKECGEEWRVIKFNQEALWIQGDGG